MSAAPGQGPSTDARLQTSRLRQAAVNEREKLLVELRKLWDANARKLEVLRPAQGKKGVRSQGSSSLKLVKVKKEKTGKQTKNSKSKKTAPSALTNGTKKPKKSQSKAQRGASSGSLKRQLSDKSKLALQQRKRSASIARDQQFVKRYNYAISELSSKRKALTLRLDKLQKRSLRQVRPYQRLPLKSQSHWDILLDEMIWMATDFIEESKLKQSTHKLVSSAVRQHHIKTAQAKYIKRKREEREHRLVCSKASEMVAAFWRSKQPKPLTQTKASLSATLPTCYVSKSAIDTRPDFEDPQVTLAALREEAQKPLDDLVASGLQQRLAEERYRHDLNRKLEEASRLGLSGMEDESESTQFTGAWLNAKPKECDNRTKQLLEDAQSSSSDEDFEEGSESMESVDIEDTIAEQERTDPFDGYPWTDESLELYSELFDDLPDDEGDDVTDQEDTGKDDANRAEEMKANGEDSSEESDDGSNSSEAEGVEVLAEDVFANVTTEKTNKRLNKLLELAERIHPDDGQYTEEQNAGRTWVHPTLYRQHCQHAFGSYHQLALQWLVRQYTHEIPGILIKDHLCAWRNVTIALLATLAGERAAWGPHLIITEQPEKWSVNFLIYCPGLRVRLLRNILAAAEADEEIVSSTVLTNVVLCSFSEAIDALLQLRRNKWTYVAYDVNAFADIKGQASDLATIPTKQRLLLCEYQALEQDQHASSLMLLFPFICGIGNDPASVLKNYSKLGRRSSRSRKTVPLEELLEPFLLRPEEDDEADSDDESDGGPKTRELLTEVVACGLSPVQERIRSTLLRHYLRATNNTDTPKTRVAAGLSTALYLLYNHPALLAPLGSTSAVPFVMTCPDQYYPKLIRNAVKTGFSSASYHKDSIDQRVLGKAKPLPVNKLPKPTGSLSSRVNVTLDSFSRETHPLLLPKAAIPRHMVEHSSPALAYWRGRRFVFQRVMSICANLSVVQSVSQDMFGLYAMESQIHPKGSSDKVEKLVRIIMSLREKEKLLVVVHQSELLDLIQERLSFGRIPHLLLNVDLEKTLLEYKLSEAMNIGLIDLKSFAAVMEQDAEVKLSLAVTDAVVMVDAPIRIESTKEAPFDDIVKKLGELKTDAKEKPRPLKFIKLRHDTETEGSEFSASQLQALTNSALDGFFKTGAEAKHLSLGKASKEAISAALGTWSTRLSSTLFDALEHIEDRLAVAEPRSAFCIYNLEELNSERIIEISESRPGNHTATADAEDDMSLDGLTEYEEDSRSTMDWSTDKGSEAAMVLASPDASGVDLDDLESEKLFYEIHAFDMDSQAQAMRTEVFRLNGGPDSAGYFHHTLTPPNPDSSEIESRIVDSRHSEADALPSGYVLTYYKEQTIIQLQPDAGKSTVPATEADRTKIGDKKKSNKRRQASLSASHEDRMKLDLHEQDLPVKKMKVDADIFDDNFVSWASDIQRFQKSLINPLRRKGKLKQTALADRLSKWTDEEVGVLLRAAEVYGTNFPLITSLVNSKMKRFRSIAQVYQKYVQMKVHVNKITAAGFLRKSNRQLSDLGPWASMPMHKSDYLMDVNRVPLGNSIHFLSRSKLFEAVADPLSKSKEKDKVFNRVANMIELAGTPRYSVSLQTNKNPGQKLHKVKSHSSQLIAQSRCDLSAKTSPVRALYSLLSSKAAAKMLPERVDSKQSAASPRRSSSSKQPSLRSPSQATIRQKSTSSGSRSSQKSPKQKPKSGSSKKSSTAVLPRASPKSPSRATPSKGSEGQNSSQSQKSNKSPVKSQSTTKKASAAAKTLQDVAPLPKSLSSRQDLQANPVSKDSRLSAVDGSVEQKESKEAKEHVHGNNGSSS